MSTPTELRDHLLQSDEEFRVLTAKHHELDERLHTLASKGYLADDEQLEEVTLKKRKLQLKDRMEDIVRRYQSQLSPSASATVASASA
jgi:uncharacterized protein YdcH (DUF465 family)